VSIFGTEYAIKGDADPDHIRELAHFVDSKMRKITEESPVLSATKVAILTALNIADELFKQEGERETTLSEVSRRALQLALSLDKKLVENQGSTSDE
jgi:cell division protein ZapA